MSSIVPVSTLVTDSLSMNLVVCGRSGSSAVDGCWWVEVCAHSGNNDASVGEWCLDISTGVQRGPS